jgi:hypothetical protein
MRIAGKHFAPGPTLCCVTVSSMGAIDRTVPIFVGVNLDRLAFSLADIASLCGLGSSLTPQLREPPRHRRVVPRQPLDRQVFRLVIGQAQVVG